MYKVKDLQIEGMYFWGGHKFKDKKEIVEALSCYHDIDFIGTDDKDNELSIEEYFKFWKINTVNKQLNWLLDYGMWKIEYLKNKSEV